MQAALCSSEQGSQACICNDLWLAYTVTTDLDLSFFRHALRIFFLNYAKYTVTGTDIYSERLPSSSVALTETFRFSLLFLTLYVDKDV